MRWAYTDADGTLHAVSWFDGQVTGDERGVSLIKHAVDSRERIDPVGTRASVSTPELAFLTIDRVLRKWFDGVMGPHPDTVLTDPPQGAVR